MTRNDAKALPSRALATRNPAKTFPSWSFVTRNPARTFPSRGFGTRDRARTFPASRFGTRNRAKTFPFVIVRDTEPGEDVPFVGFRDTKPRGAIPFTWFEETDRRDESLLVAVRETFRRLEDALLAIRRSKPRAEAAIVPVVPSGGGEDDIVPEVRVPLGRAVAITRRLEPERRRDRPLRHVTEGLHEGNELHGRVAGAAREGVGAEGGLVAAEADGGARTIRLLVASEDGLRLGSEPLRRSFRSGSGAKPSAAAAIAAGDFRRSGRPGR